MTRILFIHGRSQENKSSDILRGEWMPALHRGLAAASVTLPAELEYDFPFYGKTLFDYAEFMDAPLDDEIKQKGGEVEDKNYLKFRSEMFEAIRERAGISEEQVNEEYKLLGEAVTKGPQNWEWVQRILKALDRHAPHLREKVLDQFVRDVYVYLTNQAVRDEINAIVDDVITDEPTIVVSHSLGTVVAYDVFTKTDKVHRVPVFITLGSPLGIEGIRSKLKPIKHPEKANRWFNAYDERDVVALQPLDGKHFGVSPAIENKNDVDNHTDNRHGIAGYLDDPEVARNIANAI